MLRFNMPTDKFTSEVSKFMGRIDQSLTDVGKDVLEIKNDIKPMKADIEDLKEFRIKVLATAGVVAFIISVLSRYINIAQAVK